MKPLPKCPNVERCGLCQKVPQKWHVTRDTPTRTVWYVKCDEPSCPMCISHNCSGIERKEWNLLQQSIAKLRAKRPEPKGKVLAKGWWDGQDFRHQNRFKQVWIAVEVRAVRRAGK